MTDTLSPMDATEAIRELRARGYVVIAPDEVDAVDDELFSVTCGCGTHNVLDAHARVVDPREVPRRAPLTPAMFERALREYTATALPTTKPSDYPAFFRGTV